MPNENPAVTILKEQRALLATAIDALQAEIRESRSRLRSFDEAIATLEGAPPPRPIARASTAEPSLMDFVSEILRSSPKGLTRAEISDALAERGRTPADNTVLSTLSRLKKMGRAVKRDRMWYAVDDAIKEEGDSVEAEPPSDQHLDATEPDEAPRKSHSPSSVAAVHRVARDLLSTTVTPNVTPFPQAR